MNDDRNFHARVAVEEWPDGDPPEDWNGTIMHHMDEIMCYCLFDDLSLNGLQDMLAGHPASCLQASPFFHYVCSNKKVTLEIVDFILKAFPGAACFDYQFDGDVNVVYPIHFACENYKCPSSVIKLLVEKNQAALGHPCHSDVLIGRWEYGECEGYVYGEGLPLNYYFTRESNIDFDTVKMLVEAHPQARVAGQDGSPIIRTISCRPYTDIEILAGVAELFLSSDAPSSLCFSNAIHDVLWRHKNIDSKTVRLLLNAWPESASHRDEHGALPIHILSKNSELDDRKSLEILTLLIEAHPLGVREQGGDGALAIHHAVRHTSPKFCNMLIDAYPESLRIGVAEEGEDDPRLLRNIAGHLPIHRASDPEGFESRWELQQMAGRIELLLRKDPDSASKAIPNREEYFLPLQLICDFYDEWTDRDGQVLGAVKLLFDAYPEAICATDARGQTPLDQVQEICSNENGAIEAVTFLETQLAYARTAQDSRAMTTLDHKGWLPLHHALRNNASLGSIKLLAKGNPFALRVADLQHSFPLHIACEFATAGVVRHLVDLGGSPLNAADSSNDSLLHRACRGGNCETANYLLGINAWGALERNTNNKLPIHLLWECEEEKVDRNSPEYVETIWRLMLANPDDAVCGFA